MPSVAIIDYGMGNLGSVSRAVEECGGVPHLIADASALEEATHIILPGVGAFGDAMENLHALDIIPALEQQVLENGIPFLGVCLGMQLLARESVEGGEHSGLGWFEAEVKPLEPEDPGVRVPHIGWNSVEFVRESVLFNGMESGRDFYFVHSFHVVCDEASDILATTPYAYPGGVTSVIGRENVFGIQCHPEKSQAVGLQLLCNFLGL